MAVFTHNNVKFIDGFNESKRRRYIRPAKITDQAVENEHYAVLRADKDIYIWDIFSAIGNVIQTVWITKGTTIGEERKVVANHIIYLNEKGA